jgi:hypothetical protein
MALAILGRRGFCSRKALMFKKIESIVIIFMRAGVKKVIERV